MAVRKAIIPVAGKGTRLWPMTSVLPKALFPLVDSAGRVRAVIDLILAEAAAAGIEEVALIVSPSQQEMLERYFSAAGAGCDSSEASASSPTASAPLRVAAKRQGPGARDQGIGNREAGVSRSPSEIGNRESAIGNLLKVAYIVQPRAEGFGEAVARGAAFVAGEEAFLLMLGDHVHVAGAGRPACAAQVTAAFGRRGGAAMVGMQAVGEADLPLVGTAAGEPLGEGVYRCTDFVEKPDAATARQRLITPGLPSGRYLAHCGLYVFSPEIFDCLAELSARPRQTGSEIALADAQTILLARHPRDYYLLHVAGRALDTGTPAGYAAAMSALSGPSGSAR